jgi:hypothetical protein
VQNQLALAADLRRLPAGRVEVVGSGDRWNPIAAMVLRQLALPDAVTPRLADVRLPVPNLYGFAANPSVVLFDAPLYERDPQAPDGRRPVPFCRRLEPWDVAVHRPYYVDLRRHGPVLLGRPFVCLSPGGRPDSYRHLPLAELVEHLLRYLERPTHWTRRQLAAFREQWDGTGAADALLWLAHAHEGLREYRRAAALYEQGRARFRGRPEFAALARRARRLDELDLQLGPGGRLPAEGVDRDQPGGRVGDQPEAGRARAQGERTDAPTPGVLDGPAGRA